ncbi:hypothetical protein PENTCL1PPCAC_18312, partial [Pristionchus entomophagus]
LIFLLPFLLQSPHSSTMKVVLCLLLVPALASAGFFDDVSGLADGVGTFFGDSFKGAQSLTAGTQKDLEGNVGRVMDLLKGIKQKMPLLEAIASDGQRKTLRQVDGFLQTVTSFSNQVKTGGEQQFNQNKGKWMDMAKSLFETGGLNEIVKLIASQSSTTSTCFIAAAILPVVYLLR